MAICKLTITTAVDGTENKIVRMGKIEKEEGGVRLRYREENAEIDLTLTEEGAEIRREGDYSLFLPLRQGKTTEGMLGLGGSQGRVVVAAHCVQYRYEQEKFEAILRYDLRFGEDKQEMQLQITATTREGK